MPVRHAYQSATANNPAHEISSTRWNANHDLVDNLDFPDVTSAPSAPTSGTRVWARLIAQRSTMFMTPGGAYGARPIAIAPYGSRAPMLITLASGTTAPTAMGCTLTTAATMSLQFTATSSNRWTSTPRKRYTTATTAGTATGVRIAYTQFYRGSAAGYGGFFFAARFGHSTNTTGYQLFAGMCASTAALGGDPSALTNMIGMGYDAGDAATGNWYIMHNDGSGTATRIELNGTGSSPNAAARGTDQGFDLYIFNPPNSSSFHVLAESINNQNVVFNGTITSDVPAADTALAWKVECRNGAVAAAATVEHNYIYVENLS